MADMRRVTGGEQIRAAAEEAGTTALMPRAVRRWVVGGLALVMTLAVYLIAVRGSAILFDLRDAISAFCM